MQLLHLPNCSISIPRSQIEAGSGIGDGELTTVIDPEDRSKSAFKPLPPTKRLRIANDTKSSEIVSDAEALRSEFTEAGITCTDMHRPEHYGCIDFDVIDPDGHRLAFGQALAPLPGPGLGTDIGRG